MQHLKRCKHTFFFKKKRALSCALYMLRYINFRRTHVQQKKTKKKTDKLQVPCTGNTKVSFMCVYNTKKRIANLRA